MSRRNRRSRSSWVSLVGANARGERADEIERASVAGIAPITAGVGFVLSRAVAILLANASGLTFLWGLVIGLALATAGAIVLASTETDSQPSYRARDVKRVPLVTAGGILTLSLLVGAVLGVVL